MDATGNASLVELIIDCGADPAARAMPDGSTPADWVPGESDARRESYAAALATLARAANRTRALLRLAGNARPDRLDGGAAATGAAAAAAAPTVSNGGVVAGRRADADAAAAATARSRDRESEELRSRVAALTAIVVARDRQIAALEATGALREGGDASRHGPTSAARSDESNGAAAMRLPPSGPLYNEDNLVVYRRVERRLVRATTRGGQSDELELTSEDAAAVMRFHDRCWGEVNQLMCWGNGNSDGDTDGEGELLYRLYSRLEDDDYRFDVLFLLYDRGNLIGMRTANEKSIGGAAGASAASSGYAECVWELCDACVWPTGRGYGRGLLALVVSWLRRDDEERRNREALRLYAEVFSTRTYETNRRLFESFVAQSALGIRATQPDEPFFNTFSPNGASGRRGGTTYYISRW